MIYFMQSKDGGPVKIGHSVDVERRHEELEAHYGKSLSILAVIEGDLQTEREMHSRFSHLQLSSRSGRGRKPELFHPGEDLMGFIGCHLLVDQNPDAIEALFPKDVLKAVRLELDEETHQELRVEAAQQRMSMAALAKKVVEEYLAKRRASK